MTNEINLDGDDNVVVQDSENVNITVNKILSKSYDYNVMLAELRDQQEVFDGIPEENLTLRLKINTKINQLNDRIEQFKREIIQLAETFDKLQVNSERLQQAREFFEKGEIGEARALLNDANEEIAAEEDQLWRKRKIYETEIEPKLIAKSEERYIQALLNRTDYANPNWFEATCNYFELSIKSYPTKENLFQFAYFLKEHTRFNEAEKLYYQYLNDFKSSISEFEYAATLNNLAILHKAQNRYDEALSEYEEALKIRRKLAETNPNTFLPYVATTLNNLAVWFAEKKEFDKALNKFEESTNIYRDLAIYNFQAYFPYLAGNLSNLALFYQKERNTREISIEYAIQAIIILSPFVENVPFTQEYFGKALNVLRDWDLSFEEVSQMIAERMKGND